jgi:hypothetical protein
MRTFQTAFDRGAKEVVCSNTEKCAFDSARRRKLGSMNEMPKCGHADSGIEIHRISVFRYETTGISWVGE